MIEHVEEILNLYATLTGYKFNAGLNVNGWELDKRMNRLARAQAIEPTNALFLMLLDEQLENLLQARTYTAFDLMDPKSDGAKRFAATSKIAGRIRELLATSGMPEVREQLQADMMRALRHYDAADREEAKKLASGRFEIANLWYSALNAMDETLDTFQFLQGEPETTTPKYVEHVLGFWSINDAIRLAMTMPNGAAMCLIRQPEGIHSFFAFVIRNGGNVSVITDKTKWAHPLAHQRSRRPDRHLDERMQRSWFPYELLEIQYLTDEDGDVVGLNVPRQEGIIPQQQRAFKLKKIKDLGGEEIVWTAFMFSLITKKFFRENWKAAELTYTGEMVEVPQIAAAAAYHANLPVPEGAYKPLQAERLHSADLLTDKVLVDAGIRSSTRANEWMEKRYAAKVPDALLNMVATPSLRTIYLRGDGTTTIEEPARTYGRPKPRAATDIVGKVHHYDATDFGTAEQVLSNRVWIARHNQAEAIAALAMEEFEARKAEILQWWEDCVDMNLDALLAATWGETFVSTSSRLVSRAEFKNKPRGDLNLMHKHAYDHRISLFDRDWADLHSYGHLRYGEPVQRRSASGHDYSTGKYRCHVTERPATTLVQFLPRLPEDLAAIAGVTVEKLPDVLQHWGRDTTYTGNSILNRLDPLEDLSNPWSDLKFGVSIFLSPFAYKHKDFPKAVAQE